MSSPAPYYASDRATLYGGDALAVLAGLPAASVDAVITDPPYSSGGMTRGDRTQGPRGKYTRTGSANLALAEFSGDNRDQRSWAYWSALWLGEALRVTRPGGAVVLFADWRQLPVATDALQAGGWVWRGIVPWAKPDPRPQKGRFAAACEYAVWGSAGPMPVAGDCLPGWHLAPAPRNREHQTQKPLLVMRELVKIAPKDGTILDPFIGSGTTGVAAVLEGRRFIGVELHERYRRVARERIESAELGYRDDGIQGVLGEVTR